MIRTQFNKDSNPIQQKGRRIPVNLQTYKNQLKGIKQADEPKHIIKIDKGSVRQFIKPIVNRFALDKTTSEQCNFNLIGGNATGTYQVQTGFYGLTEMLAEVEKAIDLALSNCTYTYA